MSRSALGVLAVLSLALAAWFWATGEPTPAGVAGRVGVILGAVWLAWPALSRVDARSAAIFGAGVLVLFFRPRAAIIVLPVMAVVIGRSRRRPE